MAEQVLAEAAWRISDAGWQRIRPHLPAPRPKPRGGRPRMPDRQALEAILFVARSGCSWKQIPRELGAASTVHDRFREWMDASVFTRLHRAGLLDSMTLHRLYAMQRAIH